MPSNRPPGPRSATRDRPPWSQARGRERQSSWPRRRPICWKPAYAARLSRSWPFPSRAMPPAIWRTASNNGARRSFRIGSRRSRSTPSPKTSSTDFTLQFQPNGARRNPMRLPSGITNRPTIGSLEHGLRRRRLGRPRSRKSVPLVSRVARWGPDACSFLTRNRDPGQSLRPHGGGRSNGVREIHPTSPSSR